MANPLAISNPPRAVAPAAPAPTPGAASATPAPKPSAVLRRGRIQPVGKADKKASRPHLKPLFFRLSAARQCLVLRMPLAEARITALVREQTVKCLAAAVAEGVSQNNFCRRLGLSVSRVVVWRQQYEEHGLAGLEPKPKGLAAQRKRGEHALTLCQLWLP